MADIPLTAKIHDAKDFIEDMVEILEHRRDVYLPDEDGFAFWDNLTTKTNKLLDELDKMEDKINAAQV